MSPQPDRQITRQVTVDPEKLAQVVEDALGAIEQRLQDIEQANRVAANRAATVKRDLTDREGVTDQRWADDKGEA